MWPSVKRSVFLTSLCVLFCRYLLHYSGNISLGATETSEHTRGQEEEAKELEIQSQKVSKLNSSQVRK